MKGLSVPGQNTAHLYTRGGASRKTLSLKLEWQVPCTQGDAMYAEPLRGSSIQLQYILGKLEYVEGELGGFYDTAWWSLHIDEAGGGSRTKMRAVPNGSRMNGDIFGLSGSQSQSGRPTDAFLTGRKLATSSSPVARCGRTEVRGRWGGDEA